MLDGPTGPRKRGRVVRRLLVFLLVAAVAAGCSGDSPAPSSAPSADQEEQPAALEMGAWHELVALPGGLVLVNGYPEDDPAPGPLELWRRDGGDWVRVPVSGERPEGRNFAASRTTPAPVVWFSTAA